MCKSAFPEVEGEAFRGVQWIDLDEIYPSVSLEAKQAPRDFIYRILQPLVRDRDVPLKIREPSPLVEGIKNPQTPLRETTTPAGRRLVEAPAGPGAGRTGALRVSANGTPTAIGGSWECTFSLHIFCLIHREN